MDTVFYILSKCNTSKVYFYKYKYASAVLCECFVCIPVPQVDSVNFSSKRNWLFHQFKGNAKFQHFFYNEQLKMSLRMLQAIMIISTQSNSRARRNGQFHQYETRYCPLLFRQISGSLIFYVWHIMQRKRFAGVSSKKNDREIFSTLSKTTIIMNF